MAAFRPAAIGGSKGLSETLQFGRSLGMMTRLGQREV